jgi:hypothetical protein
LGTGDFVHPVSNYDLAQDFSLEEIAASEDVQSAMDQSWITVVDENGDAISSIKDIIDTNNASEIHYDPTVPANWIDPDPSTVETALDTLRSDLIGSVDIHSDVDVTTNPPALNDFLIYDGANWSPSGPSGLVLGPITTHSDVDTTTNAPLVGDTLSWDGTNWVPSSGQSTSNNFVFAYDTGVQYVTQQNIDQTFFWSDIGQIDNWVYNPSTGDFLCNQTGQYAITIDLNTESTNGNGFDVWQYLDIEGTIVLGSHQGVTVTNANVTTSISRTLLFDILATQNLKVRIGSSAPANVVRFSPAHLGTASEETFTLDFAGVIAADLGTTYFTINSPLAKFIAFFNLDGISTPPTPPAGTTLIPIPINTGDTPQEIGNAVDTALSNATDPRSGEIVFTSARGSGQSTIVTTSTLVSSPVEWVGNVEDTVITNNAGIALNITQQGSGFPVSASLTLRRLT